MFFNETNQSMFPIHIKGTEKEKTKHDFYFKVKLLFKKKCLSEMYIFFKR